MARKDSEMELEKEGKKPYPSLRKLARKRDDWHAKQVKKKR
jgi:hypothetical protein